MTTEEFDREFDLLYNNIMSNTAPSIDWYEKSVFLTKAQEEVVAALYNGTFEGTEQISEGLKTLVVTKQYNSTSDSFKDDGFIQQLLSKNSKAFMLESDVWFIIYEALSVDNKDIPVRPIKHDEFNRIRNNPFKRQRNSEALRLLVTLKTKADDIPILEVISNYDSYIYKIRYIRKPKPIILDNDEYLSINGYTCKIMECELPEVLHRTILDMAVKLAAATYKQ